MSDSLLKICGAALLCTALILVLKKSSAESALLMKAIATVAIGGGAIMALSPVLTYVYELSEEIGLGVGVSPSVIGVLLKATCIALISYICASVCRDCGEGNIAYFVELGGKIEILILSLELIGQLISSAREILEMV